MNTKLIKEELQRIANLMGVTQIVINESATLLKLIMKGGAGIEKILTKDGLKKVPKDVLSKAKSNFDNLTREELKIILKNLDYKNIAKEIYKDGQNPLAVTRAFDTSFTNLHIDIKNSIDKAVKEYKTKTSDYTPGDIEKVSTEALNRRYDGILKSFETNIMPNNEGKAFFNTVNDADYDELRELGEEFFLLMKADFNTYIQKVDPQLFVNIGQKAKKRKLTTRQAIDKYTPKNLATIRRTVARIAKDNDELQKEFIEVAEKWGKVLMVGGKGDYYTRKLTDIIGIAGSRNDKSIENLYDYVLRDKIENVARMEISKKQIFQKVIDELKTVEEETLADPIVRSLKQWGELIPFYSKFTKDKRSANFWTRWFAFVLKGTPDTFEEIVLTLRKRGVKETLARKVAAAYIAKFTFGPFIFGFFKTLYNISLEASQAVGFGEGVPGVDIKDGFVSWSKAFMEDSLSTLFSTLSWSSLFPFTSYVNLIIDAIVALDKTFKNEDDVLDNALDDVIDDETRNEVDSLRTPGEDKLNLPNTDIPIELLEALDGELDYLKEKVYKKDNSESYLINRPDGEKALQLSLIDNEWKIQTIDRNGVIGYEKLINDKVIKSLKKLIPKTQSESVLNKSKKMLEEQLQIDDGPEDKEPIVVDDPENKFDEKIKKAKDKISAIKDSQTALIAKEYWDKLWAEIENKSAEGKNQLKILLLQQELNKKSSKVLPAGATMNFVDCTGWNTLGCKSESIKKLQTCLNVGASGNFDEYLKNELARYPFTYAFMNGFNDSDVQKICNFREVEDKNNLIKQEMLARDVMKSAELNAFLKKYPKGTTLATGRDEF